MAPKAEEKDKEKKKKSASGDKAKDGKDPTAKKEKPSSSKDASGKDTKHKSKDGADGSKSSTKDGKSKSRGLCIALVACMVEAIPSSCGVHMQAQPAYEAMVTVLGISIVWQQLMTAAAEAMRAPLARQRT